MEFMQTQKCAGSDRVPYTPSSNGGRGDIFKEPYARDLQKSGNRGRVGSRIATHNAVELSGCINVPRR